MTPLVAFISQEKENNVQTLLATYAVAWVGVTAYVTWLAVGSGRLARRLQRLETLLNEHHDDSAPRANAA